MSWPIDGHQIIVDFCATVQSLSIASEDRLKISEDRLKISEDRLKISEDRLKISTTEDRLKISTG
jgi:hypothetical protein